MQRSELRSLPASSYGPISNVRNPRLRLGRIVNICILTNESAMASLVVKYFRPESPTRSYCSSDSEKCGRMPCQFVDLPEVRPLYSKLVPGPFHEFRFYVGVRRFRSH